jgi:hypothetical protein
LDYTTVIDRLISILEEDCPQSSTSKFLISTPTIKLTSEVKNKKAFTTKKQLKVFKKSKVAIVLNFLLVAGLLSLLLFGLKNDNPDNGIFAIIFYYSALVVLVRTLWRYFYSDVYNFTIYIDYEGIQINDEILFRWNEIEATAIINYPGKGEGLDKLVILLKNDTYWKYDLLNFFSFGGIGKTISNYIEFYKQKNFAQH